MPSRNIIKVYAPDSYYHVYARGVNRQNVFNDAVDYKYFTQLFARYLSQEQMFSKDGVAYPHFSSQIQLIAYCLMKNHYHLMLYQKNIDDVQKFMRCINTSYSRYFNLRHKRSGPLFESKFKAVRIDQEAYYQHITRYIHLNPRYWQKYYNSSLKFYREGDEPGWLTSIPILSMFSSREKYMEFVADCEEMRDMLAELKYQLADH